MKYDFICETHGVFEVEQRMSETTSEYPCPTCKLMCPKHISVQAPVHFKGGDWPGKKPSRVINTNDDWVTRRQKEKQF